MAEPDFRLTQDNWAGAVNASDSRPFMPLRNWMARHGWLVRLLILGLAAILFELTANAAVSTAVGCLEFGRTDFGTARWIKRTDPDRRRGRLCARCYLAWAFLRVSMVCFIIILVVANLEVKRPNAGQPQALMYQSPHFIGAGIMLLAAMAVGAFLSFQIVVTSLRACQKIWLGPEAQWAKQEGVWPPTRATRRRPTTNQADALFYMGIAFADFWALLGSIFVSFRLPDHMIPGCFLVLVGVILLGSLAVLPILKERITALTPADCWPDDPAPMSLGDVA